MAYNYCIIVTTTIVGGVLQFTCQRYEKFNSEIETKKSKKRTISKFIAKHGLVTGISLGVGTIFLKEGFILLKGRFLNSNPEVVVLTKPKSLGRLATSKEAILSLISGGFLGSIWILR